jgi:20S proteasome alpha/beta subunit
VDFDKHQIQADREGLTPISPEQLKEALMALVYEYKRVGGVQLIIGGRDDYQVLICVGQDEYMAPLIGQSIALKRTVDRELAIARKAQDEADTPAKLILARS